MTLIVKSIDIPFSHSDIIRLDIDRQVLLHVEDSSPCVVPNTRGRDLDFTGKYAKEFLLLTTVALEPTDTMLCVQQVKFKIHEFKCPRNSRL